MGIRLEAVKKVPKRKLLSELKDAQKGVAYWQKSIDDMRASIIAKEEIIAFRQKHVAYHQAFIEAINAELPLRRTRPRKN
jgi:hypothetical protein